MSFSVTPFTDHVTSLRLLLCNKSTSTVSNGRNGMSNFKPRTIVALTEPYLSCTLTGVGSRII